jgi:hypothetical protein
MGDKAEGVLRVSFSQSDPFRQLAVEFSCAAILHYSMTSVRPSGVSGKVRRRRSAFASLGDSYPEQVRLSLGFNDVLVVGGAPALAFIPEPGVNGLVGVGGLTDNVGRLKNGFSFTITRVRSGTSAGRGAQRLCLVFDDRIPGSLAPR